MPDDVTPFADLLKVNTTDSGFRSECDVARKFILDEIDGKSITSVPELCELLLPMKKAFPSVYKLYAGALTFGASTAVCEASFSVLTKLITKNRQPMSQGRKTDLVILAFCQSRTKRLDMDKFLHRFASDKRRLQLY